MLRNTNSRDFTEIPSKYPQKWFNNKPCRECGKEFKPVAPSHLYCSDQCAERAYNRRYIEKNYDISLEQYEKMWVDPTCRICGSEGFVINRNSKAKLAIDHDHETGEVRGLLCHNCNRALGLFKDNPETLRSAIEYLEGATTSRKTYGQVAGSAQPAEHD